MEGGCQALVVLALPHVKQRVGSETFFMAGLGKKGHADRRMMQNERLLGMIESQTRLLVAPEQQGRRTA